MKKISLIAILTTGIYLSFFVFTKTSISAPPTLFKDTLSSSQLSYFARIGTGVSSGDSLIRVALTGNPTNDTNNLFVGDTVAIGTTATNGPLTIYTVKDIGNTALFQINAGIGQSNAFVGAAIIATHSAIHTISFTPQSNFTGGYWEFLIKASNTTGETINDGIPDTNGFDLGSTTPTSTANGLGTRLKITDVTCPNWGIGVTTAFSVGTTAIISTGIGSSGTYHVVSCYLGVGGTNSIGTSYAVTIGKDLSTGSQLINPSPKDSNEGAADIYTFFIRHRDSTSTLFDSDTVQGRVAMVEAIRVSATIDPTITFTIDAIGTGSGATICGSTLGSNAANTTATQVAFGSISLGVANDLAQRLSCTTNSNNGYVVTVYEDGKMKNITTGSTLPDTTCPANSCSVSTPALWTTYSASGWGYSIENISVGNTIFNYQSGYKPFGDGYSNAQQIMKSIVTPSGSEQAYMCYRLAASTIQEAGNYENRLIYTATATF